MRVGVVGLVEVSHGIDDALWLLRGRSVVEVDQLLAVRQAALENGEIGPYRLDIESHGHSSD